MQELSPSIHSARPSATQINWLELARFAAAGQGHADLGRGVQRLATLAAAVHREQSVDVALRQTQWQPGPTPGQRGLLGGDLR